MSDGPGIRRVAEWQTLGGVADFDQLHAAALEILRTADAFVLVATERGKPHAIAVNAIPENDDDGRRVLLATIDHARRALSARNRRQKGRKR